MNTDTFAIASFEFVHKVLSFTVYHFFWVRTLTSSTRFCCGRHRNNALLLLVSVGLPISSLACLVFLFPTYGSHMVVICAHLSWYNFATWPAHFLFDVAASCAMFSKFVSLWSTLLDILSLHVKVSIFLSISLWQVSKFFCCLAVRDYVWHP